jgi:AAA domain (dynein-related subfamily)/CbbQ/NirQ/NorQ C-terminal
MRKSKFTPAMQEQFITDLAEQYQTDIVTTQQVLDFVKSQKMDTPYFFFRDESRKVGRGKYRVRGSIVAKAVATQIPESAVAMAPVAQIVNLASKRAQNVTESFVPSKNETYVSFGFFNDLKNIIKSNIFYPIYITGLSGNGKTFMIEQVCAQLKRELIRVNITKRTDESDLIGSYELIDGSTVRREGPVITAMRRGAVLLLDECDLGTEDILCLQPILEGNPYFDKKTGEVIHPAAGFNVIATANTKGKGSDDGRFIGTNVLNEAFLERFAITVEQEYPPANVERKILDKNFDLYGITDKVFIDRLITWAEVIRKSFADGAVDEVISTRRLVHIAKAFSIFGNRLKAIELCLNRFDTDTKTAFLDLYTKVDAEAVQPQQSAVFDFPPISEMTVARDLSDDAVIFSITLPSLPATLSPLKSRVGLSTIEIMKQSGMSDDEIKQKFYNELKQFHLSGSPVRYPNTPF